MKFEFTWTQYWKLHIWEVYSLYKHIFVRSKKVWLFCEMSLLRVSLLWVGTVFKARSALSGSCYPKSAKKCCWNLILFFYENFAQKIKSDYTLNPQAPVARKIADEVVFRRFQGERGEFFLIRTSLTTLRFLMRIFW